MDFSNIKTDYILLDAIFNFTAILVSFEECFFEKINLAKGALLKVFGSEFIMFLKIKMVSIYTEDNLIEIFDSNSITFNHSIFQQIATNSDIIFTRKKLKIIFFQDSIIIMKNTDIKVELILLTFLINNVNVDLINILNSKILEIDYFFCEGNNLLKTTYLHELKGGCLRTANILKRRITNLCIKDSYSTQTNIGLKIIDSQIDLQMWMKSSFNLQANDVN